MNPVGRTGMLGNAFGRTGKAFRSGEEEKRVPFMARVKNTDADAGSDLDKEAGFFK